MGVLLRTLAPATLALLPALLGDRQENEASMTAPLRATLRPGTGTVVPPWLETAVCDRAVELGQACTTLAAAIDEEARLAGLDPHLLLAIIEVESAWDPRAVSNRDARGLMQLRRPALQGEAARGRLVSTNAHDPVVNVRAGIRYLARQVERFHEPELALVAYNAGPNRLAAYLRAEKGIPARFWDYPRRIRREERRLRARLATPPQLIAASENNQPVQ